MKIKSFRTYCFRNLADTEIKPSGNINIIYGENAQGKTNLIEGIYLFSGMKSFRGAKDSELKKFGSEKTRLQMEFYSHRRKQNADIEINLRRSSKLNGVPLNTAEEMTENIHIIVFSPDLLSVIKEGPKERRRFLDTAIGEMYPKYQDYVKKYKRILYQRGAILKNYKQSGNLNEVLDEYDNILSVYGAKIIYTRKKYLEKLSGYLPKIYCDLTKKRETIEIKYKTEADITDKECDILYEKIKASRQKDILYGMTHIGPHHDDIEFLVNGTDAKKYGSQGQQRSIILAVKLAEAEMLKEITGEQPVALLDDVMSELDLTRQDYILNHIKNWQVFITCCEPETIGRLKKGNIYEVKNGTVTLVSAENNKKEK